jgi:hypothetical protein
MYLKFASLAMKLVSEFANGTINKPHIKTKLPETFQVPNFHAFIFIENSKETHLSVRADDLNNNQVRLGIIASIQ